MHKINEQDIENLLKKIKIIDGILIILGLISYTTVYLSFSNNVLGFFISLIPACLWAASQEVIGDVRKIILAIKDTLL